MIRDLLFVLAGFVVVGTLLPFVRSSRWWIRMLDFPRLQIALVGLVILAGLLAVADEDHRGMVVVMSGLVGVCVLYQLYRILPYTPLTARQVRSVRVRRAQDDRPPGMSLLISNVLMENRNAEPLLTTIRRESPDVILLVETDAWWLNAVSDGLAGYGYRVEHPLDNTYGMLLYSRYPLLAPRVEHLVEDGVPSIWTQVDLGSGEIVDLVCVHPRPPRPDKLQDTDQRDAELLAVGRRLRDRGRPTIVAGDLNDVAWSRTTREFQRMAGLLDPRRGRGMFNTFHADHVWLRYPLDHVFHTSHFRLRRMKRLDHIGSDHFPVLVALERPRSGEEPDAPRGRIHRTGA